MTHEAKEAMKILKDIKDKVYNILNGDDPEQSVAEVERYIEDIIDRIEEAMEGE